MQHRRSFQAATPFLALALACTPAANGGGGDPGTGGQGVGGATGGSRAGGTGGSLTGGAGGAPAGQRGTGGTGTGGSSGGTAGGGGGDGSGGSTPPTTDAAAGSGGGSDGPATDAGPTPLMECSKPSIDRLTWWKATGEGTTVPMAEGTSLLVKEGDHYVAKQQFIGGGWHVFEILVGPTFETKADLSKSSGFSLTYNTTGELYMQMRPASKYSGGGQWATKIPSTGGQTKHLGQSSLAFASTINQVRGLLLVGQTANQITVSQLRIDGFSPTCP